MVLKMCSCKKVITTKNICNVSRNELGLWFTHIDCGSTGLMVLKKAPVKQGPEITSIALQNRRSA